MGQSTGMSGGQMGLSLLKSGLGGLSQGLANYSNPNRGFDFSKLAQASQVQRPALGQGVTPNYKRLQGMDPFSANPNWGGDPNVQGGNYT